MEEVRMNGMEMYSKGFQDGFRAAQEIAQKKVEEAKPEAVTELPAQGSGMPSDAEMLLYATPFFETEEDKKQQAALDDAEENEK